MHIWGLREDKLPIPKSRSYAEYVAVQLQASVPTRPLKRSGSLRKSFATPRRVSVAEFA